MTTKAEAFRSEKQRSASKKTKSPPKPRRDTPVDTAQPGVSATARKSGTTKTGATSTAERNRKKAKGGAALEDSAKKRPSRKSTRKSSDGTKRDSNLALRATRKTTSPKARARRSIAKAK
jgi:hypothetical protein